MMKILLIAIQCLKGLTPIGLCIPNCEIMWLKKGNNLTDSCTPNCLFTKMLKQAMSHDLSKLVHGHARDTSIHLI